MSFITGLAIIATTLASSFISGIFGMAGGMILMGVLVALVPVATAMITHGAIMMVANGWRAYLLRDDVVWSVFWRYMIGAVIGILLLFFVVWRPDKLAVLFILGLVPVVVWIPRKWLDLDVQKPFQSELAGLLVQGMNTLAGVAGPLLDIFFVRTSMTRQQIVATKSATQAVSHIIKIVFWSAPIILAAAGSTSLLPPLWLLAVAIPTAMAGTALGKGILERMQDDGFRRWVKGLVTLIGASYFIRAAIGYGWI
ncbi:MAG: sulfite exporter TauE/SafE family protein [Pseudomonadota bacterium]